MTGTAVTGLPKTNVCVMFPNNSTSVHLGNSLLSDMANIAFFIPEGIHEQVAFTAYEEVKLAGSDIDVLVEKVNDFGALNAFDTIIFPLLDVDPKKSRKAFSAMCSNLFKKMLKGGIKFKENVHIIFGGNISGLIAAREFGLIFPRLKEKVLVPSSIYNTSIKVFGKSKTSRAFPVHKLKGQSRIVYNGEQNEKIDLMDCKWSVDSFNHPEGVALAEIFSNLDNCNGDYSNMEVVGRFPSVEEAEAFQISVETPVWLPASRTELGEVVKQRNILISSWMENGYVNKK